MGSEPNAVVPGRPPVSRLHASSRSLGYGIGSGRSGRGRGDDEERLMTVRVLQVVGGSKFGGAVWVVLSYVEALQEHGCEVTVCSSVEPVADVFRAAGCEIVSIDEMTREIHPWRDLVSLVRLTKVCRQGGFDVVHTHTSKGGFIGRAAARLAGTPIVLHTAHGLRFTSPPRLSLPLSIRGSSDCRAMVGSRPHRKRLSPTVGDPGAPCSPGSDSDRSQWDLAPKARRYTG